jgi:hypothetical protein
LSKSRYHKRLRNLTLTIQFCDISQSSVSATKFENTYSRGQKKVGQCFFDNVNLLALSMVTMKILFIYYSNPGLLNSVLTKFLNKTCPTFFCPRLYLYFKNGDLRTANGPIRHLEFLRNFYKSFWTFKALTNNLP